MTESTVGGHSVRAGSHRACLPELCFIYLFIWEAEGASNGAHAAGWDWDFFSLLPFSLNSGEEKASRAGGTSVPSPGTARFSPPGAPPEEHRGRGGTWLCPRESRPWPRGTWGSRRTPDSLARGPPLRSQRVHLCLAGRPELAFALLPARPGPDRDQTRVSPARSGCSLAARTPAALWTWPDPASRGLGVPPSPLPVPRKRDRSQGEPEPPVALNVFEVPELPCPPPREGRGRQPPRAPGCPAAAVRTPAPGPPALF